MKVSFHITAEAQDGAPADAFEKLSADLAAHVRQANFIVRVEDSWHVDSTFVAPTIDEELHEGRY